MRQSNSIIALVVNVAVADNAEPFVQWTSVDVVGSMNDPAALGIGHDKIDARILLRLQFF